MDIFDSLIKDTLKVLDDYPMVPLAQDVEPWEILDKNIYLFDKNTAFELGGYPKESVNMLTQSSNKLIDGFYVVGDENLIKTEKHLSFGKIVILKIKDIDVDNIYDFSQEVLLKDAKSHFKDVMTRASSKHYYINYKVSKDAQKAGFSFAKIANAIKAQFMQIDAVEDVSVIFIIGDSDIYKKLLPLCEKTKEATIALNHMFDGVDMDCHSCTMNDICDEVQGLRKLHKQLNKKN